MKKFVYLATLVASLSLSLASCSQDEPITQPAENMGYSTEITTRGSDGYVYDCTHIEKYGSFLTDLSNIQDQQTLLWLKNAMWSDPNTNYFKTANAVNDASFLIVGKRDALIKKSSVKAFYDQDKPIVVLEPGSKADFEWWLGEMGDPTMKFNVNANAQIAYLSAKGNPIAVIFTKNRAIVVNEADSRNPNDNAKQIIENLNGINTHATVKVLKYPVVANDPVCQSFVNSLSGIDPNPDFSNFLVIGQQEALDNKDLVEKFCAENKPVVLIGPDILRWTDNDFRSWAHKIGGTVAIAADSATYIPDLLIFQNVAIVFNKYMIVEVCRVGDFSLPGDLERTTNHLWDNFQTYF